MCTLKFGEDDQYILVWCFACLNYGRVKLGIDFYDDYKWLGI